MCIDISSTYTFLLSMKRKTKTLTENEKSRLPTAPTATTLKCNYVFVTFALCILHRHWHIPKHIPRFHSLIACNIHTWIPR